MKKLISMTTILALALCFTMSTSAGSIYDGAEPKTRCVNEDGSASLEKIIEDLEWSKANTPSNMSAVSTIANGDAITYDTIAAINNWEKANNKNVRLSIWTSKNPYTISGDCIMAVYPSNLTAFTNGFKLRVEIESDGISKLYSKIAKGYTNQIAIVHISQTGNLGDEPVLIDASIDMIDFNMDSLIFYLYSPETNTIKRLDNIEYDNRSSGKLSFSTGIGGYIVVTDKPLKRR